MSHIILTLVTIAIVRVAWVNFKKLGVLRKQMVETEVGNQQYQTEQMRYISWILACLVLLAIAPFAFTLITK